MRSFTLFLFALFTVGVFSQDLDYGIMLDAGSSGTRIYLYQWPHRDHNTIPLVNPTSINQTIISKKNNNPLANYTTNPGDVGASLGPLIDYVKSNLSPTKYSATPIYLKATAGMRAISQSDQDTIMASVRQYLKTTPFEFSDSQAKVIPGTDEGVFSWITVNYALQLLQQSNPTTFGALDMGGASTQITFSPQSPPAGNSYNETLGPNYFSLYTYSYPFGLDQAGRLLLNGLLSDGVVDGQGNIQSPCYLAGWTEPYNGTMAVGTGDYTACQNAIRKYIVTTASNCPSTCGIGNVYQPPVFGSFYAFSGFAYTNQFYKLSNTSTIADLRNAGSSYCALQFSAAKTANPGIGDNFLKTYCFTAMYITEILAKYGFSDSSTQIITQTIVGSIELTWALGGMIFEANLLPFGVPDTSSSTATSVVPGCYGLILLFVMYLFV